MSQESSLLNTHSPASTFPRVIVLTAIQLEFRAVVSHLKNTYESESASPFICECGEFVGERHTWDVIVAETGPGNIEANGAAITLIKHFQPDLVMFVGIAGKLKLDLQLGDVVASRKVYFYEGGKANEDSYMPRLEIMRTPDPLVQRAQAVARKDEWRLRIKVSIQDKNPIAHVGAIAAGEILGAHPEAPEVKRIKENCNDALVMEMEGYGAMRAAYSEGVSAIVIRAVSDNLVNKTETDAAGGQVLAVANASAFAFEFLSKLSVFPKHSSPLTEMTTVDATNGTGLEGRASSKNSETQKSWVITLNGNLSQLAAEQKTQLLVDLRAWSGDPNLQIDRVEPGSIVIYFKSKSQILENLSETRSLDTLPLLAGFKIMSILDIETHAFTSKIINSFKSASETLVRWPTTLGNHHWLQRKELTQLEDLFRTQSASRTLLIGDPGTGKSSILSKLAQLHTERGIPTLAIKADYLPHGVESLDTLGEILDLPLPPDKCIQILSRQGKVLVIIDQLDALADLVDLHSDRLNVLLTLIKRIAKFPNVHLLASCRRFEFNHDIRLTSIDADVVTLSLPDWQDVDQILREKTVEASTWPEPARELLLIPLHLKLFLQLLDGSSEIKILSTYHHLFGELWKQRVLNPSGSNGRSQLLTKMAIEMADKETLWLPIAKFDREFQLVLELEAAGVLARTSDGSRVGFSHQKLFEFARARAFAQTGESLSAFALARQDGLFVRSKIWASLSYLRSVDQKSFLVEFEKLWSNPDLRIHLRHLLIEFLAEVDDPGTQEVSWLFAYLDNREFQKKILWDISGKKSWFFELKKTRLPALMKLQEPEIWDVVTLLAKAWPFAHTEVLASLKTYWLPTVSLDKYTIEVLRRSEKWDEESVQATCTVIARSDCTAFLVSMIASSISLTLPQMAPKVVAAKLNRELANVRTLVQNISIDPTARPETEDENAREIERIRHKKLSALLENSRDWYDLPEIASAAPASFLEHVWPWFVEVSDLAAAEGQSWRFRDDWSLATSLLGARDAKIEYPIVSSVEQSIRAVAKDSPNLFLSLLNTYEEKDILVVQRLLARGLIELASTHHEVGMSFLLGNPKRLSLGSHRDSRSDTIALISSLAPHLTVDKVHSIEEYILEWLPHGPTPEKEAPQVKKDRLKWDRDYRVRLLRTLPYDLLSSKATNLIGQADRASESTIIQEAIDEGMSFIGSPMSLDQMKKAKDDDILGLFSELKDQTGWHHPKQFMKGGSIQASREFAELVKNDPDRGVTLISKMSPGSQERPASYALEALAGTDYPPSKLFELVTTLHDRGFQSQEFRATTASALKTTARGNAGLPDNVCTLLEQWLERPWPIEANEHLPSNSEEHSRDSILWSGTRFRNIPQGSYTVLEAIFSGLMFRQPMETDRWLAVLEKHLLRAESVSTWNATAAFQLMYLVNASNRKTAIQFLDDLFDKYPDVLTSTDGVMLLAKVRSWIPDEMFVRCLKKVRNSDWPLGPQAYGEILFLGHLSPQNDEIRSLFESALAITSFDNESRQIRLGITHAAAALWADPASKQVATNVLISMLPESDPAIAQALMSVFWRCEELSSDWETIALLRAIQEHPSVLKNADPSHLVSRIQDLLLTEPDLVYSISIRVLEEHSKNLVDMASASAFSSIDLINIALTLHRFETPDQRRNGLDLFEKLLSLNVYGSRDALLEIDGRHASTVPNPLRRRRRKKPAA